MAPLLGYCTTCNRMRWLAVTGHFDRLGTPHGTCQTCYREKFAARLAAQPKGDDDVA